jgi:CHAT domain-containing protein
LQQAQLALLHGGGDAAEVSEVRGVAVARASTSKAHSASRYGNPYYWAPFILIGNWK